MPFDRFGDDFNEHARRGAERLRAEDRDDFNHAMAPDRGDNGRMLKHVNADGRAIIKARKNRDDTARFLREFWLTQEYLVQYAAFGETLHAAETQIQSALAEMRGALADLESAIKDAQAGGTRLSDGRIVFLREDGSVIDQDGKPVDPADVEGVEFKSGAMSGDEYKALLDAREATAQQIAKAERFQIDVLGHARDRYEDQTDRITPDEMEQLDLKIDNFIKQLSPAIAPATSGMDASSDLGIQPPTKLPEITG